MAAVGWVDVTFKTISIYFIYVHQYTETNNENGEDSAVMWKRNTVRITKIKFYDQVGKRQWPFFFVSEPFIGTTKWGTLMKDYNNNHLVVQNVHDPLKGSYKCLRMQKKCF